MFNVVVHRRKRRAWSARTVAVSVGAHLLVLAGVFAATGNADTGEVDPRRDTTIYWPIPPKKEPSPPAPVTPATPPPAQPKAMKEGTPELQPPERIPTRFDPPDPGAPPPPPDPGEGPAGGGTGTPTSTPAPQPPTGGTGKLHDFRDSIPEATEQLPQLLNPREAQRILERVYPGMLRDAGVTGHTTVLLVIDRNGAVRPGSVTVQETSHEAFRDAAVHAAERFRFRPARVSGQPVAVRISIPIEWTIQP
jgi:protein TonB